MNKSAAKAALAILESIKPGKTYPRCVHITERVEGKPLTVKFLLQSYFVGMYAAIYVGDATMPHQTGDHNNKSFVSKLKRDVLKAIERGATVEFGTISPVQTTM